MTLSTLKQQSSAAADVSELTETPSPQDVHSVVRTRRLFVKDQVLDAYIGIYDHEKAAPQPVIVSVEVSVRYDEGHLNDAFDNVLNYEQITEIVKEVVGSGHINLVETMADRIALGCLADPMVLSAKVEVTKPKAIAGVGGVGVVVEHTQAPEVISG